MGTYDWTEEREESPPIPEGYHRVTISKVFTADKTGKQYDRDGVRRILVIVEDDNGGQGLSNFDVEGKYDWTLRALVQACGLDTSKMNAAGVTPLSFLDQKFASNQLEGRTLWVDVKHKASGGKTYCNWQAVRESDVPAHALKGATVGATPGIHDPIAEEDIPF